MRQIIGEALQLSAVSKAREQVALQLEAEEWDIWATITFRKITLLETAQKQFKAFFKYQNKHFPDVQLIRNKIKTWVFYEKNKTRPGVHIHALIRGIDPTHSAKLQSRCYTVFGDSKIRQYDANLGAARYVSRKLYSTSLEHHDFYTIHSKRSKIDKK